MNNNVFITEALQDLHKMSRMSDSKSLKESTSRERDYNSYLRESIRRILHRLNEAQMSPEDARDSELLRSIFNKSLKRKNAKLTPEEQEVMAKYGLKRGYEGDPVKPLDPDNPYGGSAPIVKDQERARKSRWDSSRGEITNDKINLADRARKIPQRGRGYEDSLGWGYGLDDDHREFKRTGESTYTRLKGKGLLDKERANQNVTMHQPYSEMETALRDRKYHSSQLAGIDAKYAKKWAELQAQMDRLDKEQKRDSQYHSGELSKTQASIDKLLGRGQKEESLKEDLSQEDQWDLNSDVYNALADVMFKWNQKSVNPSENDMDLAYDWFSSKFWDSDDYLED